jgi:hypothetical protein
VNSYTCMTYADFIAKVNNGGYENAVSARRGLARSSLSNADLEKVERAIRIKFDSESKGHIEAQQRRVDGTVVPPTPSDPTKSTIDARYNAWLASEEYKVLIAKQHSDAEDAFLQYFVTKKAPQT